MPNEELIFEPESEIPVQTLEPGDIVYLSHIPELTPHIDKLDKYGIVVNANIVGNCEMLTCNTRKIVIRQCHQVVKVGIKDVDENNITSHSS